MVSVSIFEFHVRTIAVPYYFGMPIRSLFGMAMGYCVGHFVRKASQKLAFYGSMGIMALGLLAKMEYITINWKKIDSDLF